MAGARIWVVNQVDFSDNRNLIVAAVTLVLGAGDFTVKLGNFTLGGIGTATPAPSSCTPCCVAGKGQPGRAWSARPDQACLAQGRDRRVARAPWARTAAGSASIT